MKVVLFCLGYRADAIKDYFLRYRDAISSDFVLHGAGGSVEILGQDALIRQTFRDQLVLEYEIPKMEADLGRPNLFIELSEAEVEAKLVHLVASFGSQRSRTWFREELLRGLMALRGMEGGASSGYAEAFSARRTLVRRLG